MCEADGRVPAGSTPGSVAEALRTAVACLDYLIPVAPELPAAACGEALATLGEVRSKLGAAHALLLRRFDALDGHDADGYGSSSAWLAAMTKMTRRDAKAAVRQMRTLGERPHLESALGAGDISDSWAREIAGWLKKLPEELRAGTEKILAEAAAAGASLEDLATITAHALAQWQSDHPDEDDDGFTDRYLQIGTTFGGAGVIRGDLTPECAAAVTAVLEALGKRAGPEDDRTEKQRFHDALQLACELLLRARLVPDRAGADTQVVVNVSLRDLRAMDGAAGLEDAWIRAVLGESGSLTGADAEAAACDAMTVPIVAGTMDAAVLDQMIDLVLGAFGHRRPGERDREPAPDRGAHTDQLTSPGMVAASSASRPGPDAMSPRARDALRAALARLAIDLVSGPAGIASTLRRGLLEHPWNTPSVPLDIGYSDTIPASIRRAVLWRDKYRCAWPRCGRPAAWCDVHHITHKKHGGKTSANSCVTLCHYHHDVAIHRQGWRIVLHPDGTTSAYGPDGQVQHSDSRPPPTMDSG
jgi:hypothetical protein